MKTTTIEYADSTTNPTRGCHGCELWGPESGGPCFAAGIHTRFAGKNPAYPRPFHVVETVPGRMAEAAAWDDLAGTARPAKPWLDGLRRIIFIGDMADNFCEPIPDAYLCDEILATVASPAGRRHNWFWFTKRARRLAEFSQSVDPWPLNLIPVVSATDQVTLRERLPCLAEVRAPAVGLSLEPLLRPGRRTLRLDAPAELLGRLWIVLGGRTGPGAAPLAPAWVRRVRDFCAHRRIPFFFKAWGEWAAIPHPDPAVRASPVVALDDGTRMIRVGRAAAGRTLDGRTHDQLPEVFTV